MADGKGAIGNTWDISGPVFDSAWFGVSGDGSNQTTALQAAIDAAPSTGGTIVVGGNVLLTTLNLKFPAATGPKRDTANKGVE